MSLHFERVVGRAVIDEGFRKRLISNPDETVKEAGFSLSKEELTQIRDVSKNGSRGEADALNAYAGGGWG